MEEIKAKSEEIQKAREDFFKDDMKSYVDTVWARIQSTEKAKDDEINRLNIIAGKINYPSYFGPCVKDLLMHMLDLDPMTRYTLQEVRNHPWFNSVDYKLIPGIIIGYNLIPVDEKILDLCVTYNCDRNKVKESVINNKYNSESALYYLLIKKLQKKTVFYHQ